MTTASTTTAGRRITNTSEEVADRLAIRELIDAYALVADRRERDEQAALYAEDGRTLVYNDPAASEPAEVLTGHAAHVEGFRVLSQYAATMPFNGQSSITLDGDSATGETYTLAHHLLDSEEGRTLLVLFIRYAILFHAPKGCGRPPIRGHRTLAVRAIPAPPPPA